MSCMYGAATVLKPSDKEIHKDKKVKHEKCILKTKKTETTNKNRRK